jgi:phosphoribosylglycinamide formyltransferase-1
MTTEQFIGAALKPVAGTFDAAGMSVGGPGLPGQFHWGPQTFQVARVLKTWRETGPCHHGSGERYVRKHWFQVLTETGAVMTIYFERQARSRSRSRWWLYTIDVAGDQDGNGDN